MSLVGPVYVLHDDDDDEMIEWHCHTYDVWLSLAIEQLLTICTCSIIVEKSVQKGLAVMI